MCWFRMWSAWNTFKLTLEDKLWVQFSANPVRQLSQESCAPKKQSMSEVIWRLKCIFFLHFLLPHLTLNGNDISPAVRTKQCSIISISCRPFVIWTGSFACHQEAFLDHLWDILLAFILLRPFLQVAEDRTNLEKTLLGCKKQHQMSEGSEHQQLEGSLWDLDKIGSAIFWKMCCWFDTFQVWVLFLWISTIVDEDELQVHHSKRKERKTKQISWGGLSHLFDAFRYSCANCAYTVSS